MYIKHSRHCLTALRHLKVCQKYSAARHIFNSLLGVWKCGQTWTIVSDIHVLLQP